MHEFAVQVEHVSKQYRIGAMRHDTLRDMIADGWRGLRRNGGASVRDDRIWALRDVSMNVRQGEIVGIVGRNGAGKTTLLKILSRITEPTGGRAVIRGRIGTLLEVGTGFHVELTGRENVFLSGAILGMRKSEIDRNFDEIVDFSGVEKFIDTPVKRYSSGMKVRLAFAVAAYLEPEILLIDEVLAVGDIGFQQKCLGKMSEITDAGRTVLFVSHNMAAVTQLCQRAVLLEDGRLQAEGDVQDVVAQYVDLFAGASELPLHERTDRTGSGGVRMHSIRFLDERGEEVRIVRSGQTLDVELTYQGEDTIHSPKIYIGIDDSLGRRVTTLDSFVSPGLPAQLPNAGRLVCRVPRLPLVPGEYGLTLTFKSGASEFDRVAQAARLRVVEGDFHGTGRFRPVGRQACLIANTWRVE